MVRDARAIHQELEALYSQKPLQLLRARHLLMAGGVSAEVVGFQLGCKSTL